MTASPPEVIDEPELRAARDGCNCPPWIDRCAHFDGRGIVLGLSKAFIRVHAASDCTCTANEVRGPYSVAFLAAKGWVPCKCGSRQVPLIGYSGQRSALYFDTHDEALVAFYEAEQDLLRGAE